MNTQGGNGGSLKSAVSPSGDILRELFSIRGGEIQFI
jgi:hypothetical protein